MKKFYQIISTNIVANFFKSFLSKKKYTFQLDWKQQTAFDIQRVKLCEEPLWHKPDCPQPFIPTTDSSRFAMGGILSQGKIGKDKRKVYAPRSPSDTDMIHKKKKFLL